MRILLAFSSQDAPQFNLLVESILHHKTVENHFLTIVPTASQQFAAEQAAVKLKEICPNTTVETMPTDPLGGWPRACNAQFAWAMQRMEQIRNTLPMLWLEADCVVKEKFWADKIAIEYSAKGKPFLGVVVPTTNGIAKDDKVMLGVGVYPANFLRITKLWKDLGPTAMSAEEPWDRYMRFEIAHHAADTKLIGDRWRTKNYRPDLTCDNASDDPKLPGRVDTDISEAVLVHGCKDGSLASLVLGKKVAFEPVETKAVAKNSLPPPYSGPPIADPFQELKSLLSEIRTDVKTLLSARQTPNSTSAVPEASSEGKEREVSHTSEASGEEQTGHISDPIWPKIRQLLEGDKNWRLTDLATAVDMPKENLKELLENKNYEVVQGGWVNVKAA